MGRLNKVETLQASELLEDCRSPAVIELLANHGTIAQYGSGSIIPADPWPDFHILVEGSVHVVHYAESGREVRVCEFTYGQAFGGFDLTGDSQVAVHTVAKTDSTAVRFANSGSYDGLDLPFYTGQCQNRCKTVLAAAGLPSLGAGNIPAVVASVAGRRILNGLA